MVGGAALEQSSCSSSDPGGESDGRGLRTCLSSPPISSGATLLRLEGAGDTPPGRLGFAAADASRMGEAELGRGGWEESPRRNHLGSWASVASSSKLWDFVLNVSGKDPAQAAKLPFAAMMGGPA